MIPVILILRFGLFPIGIYIYLKYNSMRAILPLLLIFFSLPTSFYGQTPSTEAEVLEAIQVRDQLRSSSILKDIPTRNIGPTVQGGRIVDLEVFPNNSHHWLVAYASGGLFETTNNGQSFEPIFDNQGALGLGDIALSPSNPKVIWIGTGENNSSRSSYAGSGIYRSTDGGENWTHCGLASTQHIGRIIVHPKDPKTAWVAAIGPLYSRSKNRGIYKTTDGGKSWKHSLFLDEKSGAIDLIIDPNNPNWLMAAFWERHREAWEFDEDGPGSSIHVSTDGGDTWNVSGSGIPKGEHTGRIGLAISPSATQVIYAFIDNQAVEKSLLKEDTIAGITYSGLKAGGLEQFLNLEDANLDSFLRGKGYPEQYSASTVKSSLRQKDYSLQEVLDYFGDANNALFNTGVKGAEVYKSTDQGQSWTRTHEGPLQGVSFTYGYYFGQVRVAPDDPNRVYITGVPLLMSDDGGANWSRVDTFRIHVDHHELWINPKNSDHMILGNDGGLYLTYDRGVHFTHINNLPVGQFYTVHVDMEEPYNVYGGLQDNGVKKGSSRSIPNRTKEWETVFGGDGMFIVTDEKNKGLVYTGFQFGNYFRIQNGRSKYITPSHDIGEPKYRFNWRTPLRQSPHNHEILYMGSQYLMRSMDMGDTWEHISHDLTGNLQPQGNVPYSTISTLSESPLKFGLIWVGSDDGRINVTTDGGNTWTRADQTLPQNLWVSKIQASPHDQQTAFVSLTGYRKDDFHTYVYKTTDLGKTWMSLQGNLPQESVNVVVQDAINPNLLYLGTDQATYLSLDGGTAWYYLSSLPNVASYDLVVHPRENELVIGTHGRSIYIVDVEPLQALKEKLSDQSLMVFAGKDLRWSENWGKATFPWQTAKTPKARFDFFVFGSNDAKRTVEIKVLDQNGSSVYHTSIEAHAGFNSWPWDLNTAPKAKEYLKAGTYTVKFKMNFEEQETTLNVKKK